MVATFPTTLSVTVMLVTVTFPQLVTLPLTVCCWPNVTVGQFLVTWMHALSGTTVQEDVLPGEVVRAMRLPALERKRRAELELACALYAQRRTLVRQSGPTGWHEPSPLWPGTCGP